MKPLPTSPGGKPEGNRGTPGRSEDNGYKFVTKEEIDQLEDAMRSTHNGPWFDVMRKLLAERDAYREVAIKFRTLWGEMVEPVGEYSAMPFLVDLGAKRLLQASEERTSSEKKGGS